MRFQKILQEYSRTLGPIAWNLLLMLALLTLCRALFIIEHYTFFPSHGVPLYRLFQGGLRFDLAAIIYLNLLYILLMLPPWPWRFRYGYLMASRILFITINSAAIAINLADTIYFPFTQRRSTLHFLSQFEGNDNLLSIIGIEFIHHWYLTLFWLGSIAALWFLYRNPRTSVATHGWRYSLSQILLLPIVLLLCVIGIRGGIAKRLRPLGLIDANRYGESAFERGAVLNTPFTVIRNIKETPMAVYSFFTESELEHIYSPVHRNANVSKDWSRKNVVCIIVESFTKENSAYLSSHLFPADYQGYTPFFDSLCQQGISWRYAFANGVISIDAMPSILAGMPRMGDHFTTTSTVMNTIDAFPALLRQMGYTTAFFHGASLGSMSFNSITKSCGLTHYYGREQYETTYPDRKDYDGVWGIYDDRFLDYTLQMIDTLQRPFVSVIFTLSTHHPWHLPAHYHDPLGPDETPHHRTIRYMDYALKEFFRKAQGMEWYKNTLFIITADHTSMPHTEPFFGQVGKFDIPILLYDPSNPQLQGLDTVTIAQQIDIGPTVLAYLGYSKPYISFGQDLLSIPPEKSFAINHFNGVYQLFHAGQLLLFSGESYEGLYDFTRDRNLTVNLLDSIPAPESEKLIKAFLQQYSTRVRDNRLSIR